MQAEHLVAHRGWQRRYPENTIAAVRGALETGARYIEVDVQLSADKEPVLFHDRSLARICRQRGAIHRYSYKNLQQFSAYEPGRFDDKFLGTPIAHLRELIDLLLQFPRAHLYLEIKNTAVLKFGNAAVYTSVLGHIEAIRARCTLISFAHNFLHYAATRGWPRVGPVLNHWNEIETPTIAALKPDVVFCDALQLPAGDLHAVPYSLVVYEVQDAAIANDLLRRGVQRVETFTVGELLETDA
jgi:glycerophosphoryl diester phosphodiesterase